MSTSPGTFFYNSASTGAHESAPRGTKVWTSSLQNGAYVVISVEVENTDDREWYFDARWEAREALNAHIARDESGADAYEGW